MFNIVVLMPGRRSPEESQSSREPRGHRAGGSRERFESINLESTALTTPDPETREPAPVRQVDYVLVYNKDKYDERRARFEHELENVGLELHHVRSVS